MHMQSRQKAATFTAWRQISNSGTASPHDHSSATQLCSERFEADQPALCLSSAAADDPELLQRALQGWRAVAMHMAIRREQMQLAVLQSADRAVRRGCHAAAGSTYDYSVQSQAEHTQPQSQLAWSQKHSQHQTVDTQQPLSPVPTNWQAHLQSQNPADHTVECIDDYSEPAMHSPASSLQELGTPASDAQALRLYIALLLAKAFKGWQSIAQGAVAKLYQQHEVKARANHELLQVDRHPFKAQF